MSRYFEDIEVGEVEEFGSYRVNREEMVQFARQYDPQPFHLDEQRAKQSIYGGLIASGWHTAAITMRLLVDHYLDPRTSRGALGVDELRWWNPVRPGDELRLRTEVVDKQPWKKGLGRVDGKTVVLNQRDDEVMSLVGLMLFARREAS